MSVVRVHPLQPDKLRNFERESRDSLFSLLAAYMRRLFGRAFNRSCTVAILFGKVGGIATVTLRALSAWSVENPAPMLGFIEFEICPARLSVVVHQRDGASRPRYFATGNGSVACHTVEQRCRKESLPTFGL